MNKKKLSILIPARHEEWLARTVQDILENKNEETEIIIGLDGELSDPPIPDHPDITIFYSPVVLGQRAITNKLCQLSKSRYVMKCDAHVSFDKNFDKKMLDRFKVSGDNVVMLPIMKNLHVFNFKCEKCGDIRYQGKTPVDCPKCDNKTDFKKELVWIAKKSPNSVSYCFDSEPHFKYFKEYAKRPEYQKDLKETGLTETMSIQGSCWMISRQKYLELNICDAEGFGSWGSQGISVSAKMWLSGGRVLVNHNTWNSHCFRTAGGDFSFPYKQHQSQVNHAKQFAKDIFFNNKYPHQIHPLSWLLEKFYPINGWTDKDIAEQKERERNHPKFGVNAKLVGQSTSTTPFKTQAGIKLPLETKKDVEVNTDITKSILFYTDNQLNLKIAHACQKQLKSVSKELGIPIISVSLKKMDKMGHNIHLNLERGVLTYYKQILTGLEASTANIIYMAEHDVLYHPSNFSHIPSREDVFCYNTNWWKIRLNDGFAVSWNVPQVSGLCAYRTHLLDFYRKKIKEVEEKGHNRSYEPGGRDKRLLEEWRSEIPYLDIRHQGTMTKDKWSPNDFRDKSTCINWRESNIKDIKGWENFTL